MSYQDYLTHLDIFLVYLSFGERRTSPLVWNTGFVPKSITNRRIRPHECAHSVPVLAGHLFFKIQPHYARPRVDLSTKRLTFTLRYALSSVNFRTTPSHVHSSCHPWHLNKCVKRMPRKEWQRSSASHLHLKALNLQYQWTLGICFICTLTSIAISLRFRKCLSCARFAESKSFRKPHIFPLELPPERRRDIARSDTEACDEKIIIQGDMAAEPEAVR